MERNRSWRRAQTQRFKNHRKFYFNCLFSFKPHEIHSDDEKKRIGRMVKTPKPCSCMMCGNPRHYKIHDWRKKDLVDQLQLKEKFED